MSGPTSYQRVTTPTDYDASVGSYYLKYDGIDDYMNLPYMGLYASGAASVVVARDTYQTGSDVLIAVERDAATTSSVYYMMRQLSGGEIDSFIRNNAAVIVLDSTGVNPVRKNQSVISAIDTGSRIVKYQESLVLEDSAYTRLGSLTLTNTTIGASVTTTTSIYAKMNYYGSIIVKGAALTDKQRKICERYLANRIGATLQ